LIPNYGVAGAAYSTLVGNLIATTYMFFAGQFYFRVAYDFKKITIILSILIPVSFFGNYLDFKFPKWDAILLIYKLLTMIVSIILILLSGIVSKNQYKLLYSYISKK
jgi:hypothetical protein